MHVRKAGDEGIKGWILSPEALEGPSDLTWVLERIVPQIADRELPVLEKPMMLTVEVPTSPKIL